MKNIYNPNLVKNSQKLRTGMTDEEKQNYKFERLKKNMGDKKFHERKNWGKNY